jgi:hypothetical protein
MIQCVTTVTPADRYGIGWVKMRFTIIPALLMSSIIQSTTDNIKPIAMAQNTMTEHRIPPTFLDGFVSKVSSTFIGLSTNETGDKPKILDTRNKSFISFKLSLHSDNLYMI